VTARPRPALLCGVIVLGCLVGIFGADNDHDGLAVTGGVAAAAALLLLLETEETP
jgi:hypothetical protein